jgi:hypothetical protein
MEKNNKYDFVNSRALFVLKIITMSFAILAFVVVVTVMLTRWIMDLDRKMKESNTKMAKAAARLNKFRKDRIKHILRQRKLQLKEEKEDKKRKNFDKDKRIIETDDIDDADMEDDCEDISDMENAINAFDNELDDIILEDGEV